MGWDYTRGGSKHFSWSDLKLEENYAELGFSKEDKQNMNLCATAMNMSRRKIGKNG